MNIFYLILITFLNKYRIWSLERMKRKKLILLLKKNNENYYESENIIKNKFNCI